MSDGVDTRQPTVPPLESGDHLRQPEFHARYRAAPHMEKAELIEGRVFMPSPVSHLHSWAHSKIIGWLECYASRQPSVEVASQPTLILDDRNEYQPDGLVRRVGEAGGGSWVDAEGYLRGTPELVVEVAVSSAAIDLREKREVYRRNGVAEYVVWQVLDGRVDWWERREGAYQAIGPSEEGKVQSRLLPGLRLDVPALLRGDMAAVFEAVGRKEA